MKRFQKRARRILPLLGIDLRMMGHALKGIRPYRHDLETLRSQAAAAGRADFPIRANYPCFGDNVSNSGTARGQYFHQDLLVAQRIYAAEPDRHVDVGSRVDGFVAHVAVFRQIDVVDIRPLTSATPTISFVRADLMGRLPDTLVECCDSLSCLHALEHFGLGRYGDPVDYDGYLRGLDNLTRLLRGGGKLYLSVPIGPQRIEFNAHRVFSVAHVLECTQPWFALDRFSYVDDRGDLHDDVPMTAADVERSFGCRYGCGIFEMTRTASRSPEVA